MQNNIDPINPKPNTHGNLEYYILQGTTVKLNGSLTHLLSGVYQNDFSLTGLSPGDYSLYINGTAINCLSSQSNIVNFTSYFNTDFTSVSDKDNIKLCYKWDYNTGSNGKTQHFN